MPKQSIAIVGGDKRNIALAQMLFREGNHVKMFGFANHGQESAMRCKNLQEAVRKAKYIIGPTPCSHNGGALNAPFHNGALYVEELFKLIRPGQVFIAGYISPEVEKIAEHYNVRVIDMLKREELLTLNAIPTAEGAIKIAIEETDITIHGNNFMIIGYGRIGTILSRMLAGMGARVSVVVNTGHAYAMAKSAGYEAIYFAEMNNHLQRMNVIYNTVPEILLDKDNMHLINEETLIIDLSSPPYGVDVAAGRDLGLKILFSGSLPGKIAPVTTATYILSTIRQIMREI